MVEIEIYIVCGRGKPLGWNGVGTTFGNVW